jgi:hypothetical protein
MLFGIVEAIVGAATLGATFGDDTPRDEYGKSLDDYTAEAKSEEGNNPTSSSSGWW